MSKLNEYIGGIVSSITNARAMCDMQTVEIARQYSEHDLLKYFSVPRMRIEDVEMTIPVAMDMQDEGSGVTSERMANAVIDAGLQAAGVQVMSKDMAYELRRKMAQEIEKLGDPKDAEASNVAEFSDVMSQWFKQIAENAGISEDKINHDLLTSRIRDAVREAASDTQQQALANMNVIIESAKLRDVQPESIIYIKMKIREDSMEWSVAENKDGVAEAKLLPE